MFRSMSLSKGVLGGAGGKKPTGVEGREEALRSWETREGTR